MARINIATALSDSRSQRDAKQARHPESRWVIDWSMQRPVLRMEWCVDDDASLGQTA